MKMCGRLKLDGYILVRMKANENTNTMKPMIDDKMAYFFGLSRGSYGEVLGDMARTKVNSFRTSSIPLTEFWQPANLTAIQGVLARDLPGFNPEVALKFFEFPTAAVWDGERVGRPSMTDIMILDGDWQVAIEGKFTEYLFAEEKTVRDWLREAATVSDLTLRRKVLMAWFSYIRSAGCTNLDSVWKICRDCRDMSYQFLHRTASACHMTNGPEGRTPVLVYQLFFDKSSPEHKAALDAFKRKLRSWSAALGLKNMKFLIISVPVTNMDDVQRRFDGQHGEIFDAMRENAIYRFDFDGTHVESVINGDIDKDE